MRLVISEDVQSTKKLSLVMKMPPQPFSLWILQLDPRAFLYLSFFKMNQN